ncbi:hypothetical protein [Streptomyces flaveolus]|uniref:hypothetical protein n=1 Tax=Streptomyces flaveolus TaxID=67297 RepID=UPI0033F37337
MGQRAFSGVSRDGRCSRPGALLGAALAGLYLGGVLVVERRRALAALPAAVARGTEEGLADVVVAVIALYEAAVFPLTPGVVSETEHQARRTVAYRLAVHEDPSDTVRVSVAAALAALDVGLTEHLRRLLGHRGKHVRGRW